MTSVNLGDVCRTYIGMQCQYGSRYASAGPGQPFEGDYPDMLSASYGDGRVLSSVTGNKNNYHSLKIDETEALEFAMRVVTDLHQTGRISDADYEERIERINADQKIDLVQRLGQF